MLTRLAALIVKLSLVLSLRLEAQAIGPYLQPAQAARPRAAEPPPLGIAKDARIESPVSLRPATEGAIDQLEAMAAWNREGRVPRQVGIHRRLPAVISANLSTTRDNTATVERDPHSIRSLDARGNALWATRITVKDAFGVRLHLTHVQLPPGTQFWIYGTEGSVTAFGLDLLSPAGDLWTPISFGDTSYLEVRAPGSRAGSGFSLLEVAEIRPLTSSTEPPCAVDAICVTTDEFPGIGYARNAVAAIVFETPDGVEQCTGTLLNDKEQDGTPYMLTANHCVFTQDMASSLEAFWDFHAPSCGAAVPSISSLPTSSGATLLAHSSTSDFSFLVLSSVPGTRGFMGWDPSPVSLATTLFRVSQPADFSTGMPLQQQYSSYEVDGSPACLGEPTDGTFVYSSLQDGYVFEGGSGSALMRDSGFVVGQLMGACPAPSNPCDYAGWQAIDGAFRSTYPAIEQWINASNPPCLPTATTLCVSDRFSVSATWQRSDGTSGQANAIAQTADTGSFWFFGPDNIELTVKVLNGCGIDGHYWVFGSGLTNVGVTVTVTDLATNSVRTYRNPVGTVFAAIQDTSAFGTCP